MINKKSLWFLTLFSLILVLSIYYITMPSELLLTTNSNKISEKTEEDTPTVTIEKSDILVALRSESDDTMTKEVNSLKEVITNSESSIEEKNKAYEKIKELNDKRGEEEKLEEQIKSAYSLDSYVKIKENEINVTISSDKHDEKLANNIIRTIQENYKDQKYITVKFQG